MKRFLITVQHWATENKGLWKITEYNKSSLDSEVFAMSLMTINRTSLVIPTLNLVILTTSEIDAEKVYCRVKAASARASEGSQEHISLLPQMLGFLSGSYLQQLHC